MRFYLIYPKIYVIPFLCVSNEYIAGVIEFNTLNERRYNEYIQRIQDNIKSDPATFWKFVKINNNTSTYPNRMHLENVYVNTPNEIVELFASHFESGYAIDDQVWNLNDIVQPLQNSTEINVTLNDIEMAIDSLKWKSGAGPNYRH